MYGYPAGERQRHIVPSSAHEQYLHVFKPRVNLATVGSWFQLCLAVLSMILFIAAVNTTWALYVVEEMGSLKLQTVECYYFGTTYVEGTAYVAKGTNPARTGALLQSLLLALTFLLLTQHAVWAILRICRPASSFAGLSGLFMIPTLMTLPVIALLYFLGKDENHITFGCQDYIRKFTNRVVESPRQPGPGLYSAACVFGVLSMAIDATLFLMLRNQPPNLISLAPKVTPEDAFDEAEDVEPLPLAYRHVPHE